jgi:hypothetical protein
MNRKYDGDFSGRPHFIGSSILFFMLLILGFNFKGFKAFLKRPGKRLILASRHCDSCTPS